MSYAVIFTSIRTPVEEQEYATMADEMEKLAKEQKGFLGITSVRNEVGVTISYWDSLEAISAWKNQLDHRLAQKNGQKRWYAYYKVEICKVERSYEYNKLQQ